MPYSLNNLSPEEKMAKYASLNGSPDPSTYSNFNAGPVTPTEPTKMPTVDFSGIAGGAMPPVLSGSNKLPKSDAITPSVDNNSTTKDTDTKPLDPITSLVNPFKEYSPTNTNLNFSNFEQRIRQHESNNNPLAVSKTSSATGYYQFLWNDWHDSIRKVTGITNRDTFLHSPDAQKNFFKFYYDNHIVPNVEKLKSVLGSKNPLNDFDLAQLIHFRGAKSARELIENGELNVKKEAYNPTALGYIMGK